MNSDNISAKTTHDLWVEARRFQIDIERASPTSISITITRPVNLEVTDGAVVLLGTKAINADNFPVDGQSYTASTDWTNPSTYIGDAQVVGAFYKTLSNPFPEGNVDTSNGTVSFTFDVTNTSSTAVYYASVHASSNVLQYYPIGVHSYPIAGVLAERGNSTYTGNIPSYPSAPTAPTPGMVYHDQGLNLVQYYDAGSGSWIPTRSDVIQSGPNNPGIQGQVYIIGGQLKIFNGQKWVDATSANIQFRSATGSWIPLASVSVGTQDPVVSNTGDVYYNYSLQRTFYYDGSNWVTPNASNSLFSPSNTMVPAFVLPVNVETEEVPNPYVGQLFYNTSTHSLNAWNGTSWSKVNTDQVGSASSNKTNIGTDGSYDDRVRLIKILMGQLGWPQMCVELAEEQFNIAIDNAIQNYRQLSAGAYRRGFVLYKLIPGQQLYYLNSAVDKTDHIVDIHKIHRLGPLGVYGGGPNDVWSQAFAQRYYDLAAGGGDILTTHLVAAYGEELNRLFAGDMTFQWDEPSHELFLTRAVRSPESIVIECILERPEQELYQDRWCQQYIQNWALAELKMMLGMIRSKFSSGTPGPGGTINLNGELLIAEANQDMTDLKESLMNYEFGGPVGLGNCSFLIG